MTLENNWQSKSLENLEKDEWTELDENSSNLVKRCFELRKIPLNAFTVEDLRVMIGQQIGLDHLIPLSIEVLKDNLFTEGNFFPGDLLKNILNVDAEFWKQNRNYWDTINELVKGRIKEIEKVKISTDKFYRSKF